MRWWWLAIASFWVASSVAAQVAVVEETDPEARVVERGYVQGQGRGVQYGAQLISPVYLTEMRHAGATETLNVGPGAGVHARIGWEFPSGFTLEVYGGIGVNGIDTEGAPEEIGDTLTRADVGLGARYMIFNQTAFVPFVQIGIGLRWFFFDWPSGVEESGAATLPIHAVVGAQIELSPFFGIELGMAVDYMFGLDVFHEGVVSIMPFAGVTLYVYDESE